MFISHSDFNPRSPWGERLSKSESQTILFPFQSTLPAGGATIAYASDATWSRISIHAPRGGSDNPQPCRPHVRRRFQSTLPVGGATPSSIGWRSPVTFQSTLPVGGATCILFQQPDFARDFNPRSPWGERPATTTEVSKLTRISIHAPRGGSDSAWTATSVPASHFNPRSPWGERPLTAFRPSSVSYFNPRSPWGERRGFGACSTSLGQFQSTLPVGGATGNSLIRQTLFFISIHAPRGGSD